VKRSEALAEGGGGREEGARGAGGAKFAVQKRSVGLKLGGFCGGQGNRGWTEGSVSALRLPDAPNIMFNDINFLLNGPRFDSRCERGPLSPVPLPPFLTTSRPGRTAAPWKPEKVYPGE